MFLENIMKKISLISPCFNEGSNIEELYRRVCLVIDGMKDYQFEYIFIDNASTDETVEVLKKIAEIDSRVKVIINNRNFGHIRSPYWGIMQTTGDATIYLASDLQDPPELIPKFIEGWLRGYKVVLATKPVVDGRSLMHYLRRLYYKLLDRISDVRITRDTTGFGLYDAKVVSDLRAINDPYPFLRGLIDELGYSLLTIDFVQPRRIRGVTKNNFYTLYDIAMLGVVSHSRVPIRVVSFIGLSVGLFSLIASIIILVLKLVMWDSFAAGFAPLVILAFLMFGLIMVSIGILGEYIGLMHIYMKKRPVVVESQRINFS